MTLDDQICSIFNCKPSDYKVDDLTFSCDSLTMEFRGVDYDVFYNILGVIYLILNARNGSLFYRKNND